MPCSCLFRFLAVFSFFLAAFFMSAASADHADSVLRVPPVDVCRQHTEHEEKRLHIPTNMLTALSHVESGHWNTQRREKTAWPWTVMARGQGTYYKTKVEAIQAVRNLLSGGVRNIDVGCMQVNLKYHPGAFNTLEDAFDPEKNVAYAAHFLKRLHEETGSWARAATRYHSATPSKAKRYSGVLVEAWNAINSQTYKVGHTFSTPSLDHPPLGSLSRPGKEALYSPHQVRALTHQKERQKQAKEHLLRAQDKAKRFAEEWRARRLMEYLKKKSPPPKASPSSSENASRLTPDSKVSAPLSTLSPPVAFD